MLQTQQRKAKQKQSLTTFAEVLDRGSNLYTRREKREQEDKDKASRKRRWKEGQKHDQDQKNLPQPFPYTNFGSENEENIDPRLLQLESNPTQFLFSRASQLSKEQISQLLASQSKFLQLPILPKLILKG